MTSTTMPSTYTTEATPTQDRRLWLLILSALVILFDRITKAWIIAHRSPGSYITVIPNVFRISHVLNTGAAFSLLAAFPPNTVRLGLIAFSVIAVLVVFAMLWRTGRTLNLTSLALALILGGALGNLYDRIRFHHVVDFLAVRIYHYDWPDFNVADSCIVIGACLLLLEILHPQPTFPDPDQTA